jgi:hypothetical protein
MPNVLVHKTCTATFTVDDGPRREIQKAIAEKLRTGEGVTWEDGPEGISVTVIWPHDTWNIRKRFSISE